MAPESPGQPASGRDELLELAASAREGGTSAASSTFLASDYSSYLTGEIISVSSQRA